VKGSTEREREREREKSARERESEREREREIIKKSAANHYWWGERWRWSRAKVGVGGKAYDVFL